GVRIAWEAYGEGAPTIVLLPSAPIVHSRQWKGQIPYLSRYWRTVVYDGRGNGLSDRPTSSEAYDDDRFVQDIVTVLDASGTGRAVLVGLCTDGVWRSIRLAAEQPDRVLGIVAFAPGVPRLGPSQPHYLEFIPRFDDVAESYDGWAKLNRHYWRRDYRGWIEFFFGQMIPEPHSSKALEDAIDWGLDVSLESILAENDGSFPFSPAEVEATCRKVGCPMVIVHGGEDRCQSPARGQSLSELTGAPLLVVDGVGHMIPARHPVLANLLIRDFVRSLPEAQP
ncbi:MAG TPA: alpha/beta hydrolase, partial [Candidatus Limnocylindrales bacterium]|nr:alpha/beta hydrolase [Candidatus Limnocylindrales bacterium]